MSSISLNQIIANAKMLLDIETSERDALLYKLAADGVRQIESPASFAHYETTLPIINFTAELPQGLAFIEEVRFDSGDECCYPLYHGRNFILLTAGKNCTDSNLHTFTEDNGYLVFSSNTKYNEVQLAYSGMQYDSDGFPLVDESMELALQAYMVWKYTMVVPKEYDGLTKENYRRDWVLQVQKARRKLPKGLKLENLGEAYNRFFVRSFNTGYRVTP